MSNLSIDSTALNNYTASLVKSSVFPDSSFLSKFTNLSAYLNGRHIEFPFYTNATGTITKNGSSFTSDDISQTEQDSVTFNLDIYRVKPFLITAFENEIINWDKAQMEITQNLTYLENYVANQVIKSLVLDRDVAFDVLTTGANGTANGADGVTAKKKIQYADFLALKKVMDKSNLKGERNLIVDAETFSEILGDTKLSSYLETSYASVVEGTYPKIAGINIIERSEVCALSSSGTVKIVELGDTMIASDIRVSLAFIGDAVGLGMGTPKVFNTLSPQFYGNVTSAEVAFGVKNLRSDKKGVYIIKQQG